MLAIGVLMLVGTLYAWLTSPLELESRRRLHLASASAARREPVEPTSSLHDHGLANRKVAIWAFIGSECMLFASLISTYLIYKGKSDRRAVPARGVDRSASGHVFRPILNIPVTSQSTFVLLMSSLAMVLALAAVENRGKPKVTSATDTRVTRSSGSS